MKLQETAQRQPTKMTQSLRSRLSERRLQYLAGEIFRSITNLCSSLTRLLCSFCAVFVSVMKCSAVVLLGFHTMNGELFLKVKNILHSSLWKYLQWEDEGLENIGLYLVSLQRERIKRDVKQVFMFLLKLRNGNQVERNVTAKTGSFSLSLTMSSTSESFIGSD